LILLIICIPLLRAAGDQGKQMLIQMFACSPAEVGRPLVRR
jgi:hypothetical protein